MFRRILLAVFFPILLLTGLTVQAVQSEAQIVTVTARYLNVRKEPSTSSPVPTAEATDPSGSKATRSVALVEGTTRTMPIRASAAVAAVAMKIAPQ